MADTPGKLLYDPGCWKELTPKEALIAWLALPTAHRLPKMQKELAALVGVSEETMSRYKKEDGFFDEVDKRRNVYFKEFYTSNVIQAIAEKACEGDPRAQKLYLQKVEEWKETTRQETDIKERREFVLMLPPEKLTELFGIIQRTRQLDAEKYIDAEVVENENGEKKNSD